MRVLSDATLAVQAGSSYTPLVSVDIGGNTFHTNDPASGLSMVETVEEGQSFRATIEIKPSVLQAIHPSILEMVKGQEVVIKWGFINPATGWVSERIQAPYLRVVNVAGLSEPGSVVARFDCVGWWELLASSRVVKDPSDADAPPPVWPGDTTVRGIINELLQGWAPVFLDSSDGVIDTYRPEYEADGLESVMTTLRNLLDMTSCYIGLRNDGFHVNYPQVSSPLTQTYALDGHTFYMRAHAAKAVVPNRIVVVPGLATADETPEFIGIALDQDSIDQLGFLDLITSDDGVRSQGEANNRAFRILQRLKAETSDGIATVPMHIGQELYDRVRVIDDRIEAPPINNFVGMIRRVWTSGKYAMEVGLGGLMPHLSSLRTSFPSTPISVGPPVSVGPGVTEPVAPAPVIPSEPALPPPPVLNPQPVPVPVPTPPRTPTPIATPTPPRSQVLGTGVQPTPTPVTVPGPVSTPGLAAAYLRQVAELQETVSRLQEQFVLQEFTTRQRRFVDRIPEPEAVVSIGAVGGVPVAGRSNFPSPAFGGGTVGQIIKPLLGQRPGRWTTISLQASNVPAALRHEVAHHILGAYDVPRAEHEPIIARARVPGTTTGVHFGLLETAATVALTPTFEQRRRYSRQLQRLAFRELRRSGR